MGEKDHLASVAPRQRPVPSWPTVIRSMPSQSVNIVDSPGAPDVSLHSAEINTGISAATPETLPLTIEFRAPDLRGWEGK